jgi:hypothetical protein
MMLKSVLVGAACAYGAYLLYALSIIIPASRRNAAIGSGAWYAWTVCSPLFWFIVCGSFALGTFLTLKRSFPPLYR